MRTKRDMDLVRLLLLVAEGDEKAEEEVQKYPQNVKHYHSTMLIDEEYIDGLYNDSGYVIKGLTWKGHEFVDTVRDNSVWAAIKKRAQVAGAWSLGLLVQIAIQEGKQRLGLE